MIVGTQGISRYVRFRSWQMHSFFDEDSEILKLRYSFKKLVCMCKLVGC